MHYRDLKKALEVLTEGRNARIPMQDRSSAEQAFEENRDWLGDRHIQGFGIAERRIRGQKVAELVLKVYVDRKTPRSEIAKPVPNEVALRGILERPVPIDVDAIGKVYLHYNAIRIRSRPAIPGSSAAHIGVLAGTMGCLVNRNDRDDELYVLSTCHSFAVCGLANVGDAIIQPSTQDGGNLPGDRIAELADWTQVVSTPTGFPNLVDAAIARVIDASAVTSDIHMIGLPVGAGRIGRRAIVRKTGRTTGYGVGQVIDIDHRFEVPWPQAGGGIARVGFRDQVLCTHYSMPGDSGAAVVNGSNRIIGLHVAGSEEVSIFCRITNVLNLLNCSLVVQLV